MSKRAVVLLSGGRDSATALAVARQNDFEAFALTFRYGQRHSLELQCAQEIARQLGVLDHVVVDIDLEKWGGSALTSELEVPKDRSPSEIGGGIPVTYVPARNTIFLSFAIAWAETLGAADVFIGVNALDYSGYPDCRPEYIAAYEAMANLATRAGVEGRTRLRIQAPLIGKTKAEIVRLGLALGVDFSRTLSCYDPSPAGEACGRCDSCQLRLRAFAENGLADPARYCRDAVA